MVQQHSSAVLAEDTIQQSELPLASIRRLNKSELKTPGFNGSTRYPLINTSEVDFAALSGELLESTEQKPISDAPIENAFLLIDELAERVGHEDENLDSRVAQIKLELLNARQSSAVQTQEKEKLTNHLATLLDILPAGVVLLDGQGCITECNPAAIELLGEPLEGEQWLDVIKRSFSPKHDDGHEVSLKDGRRVRIETRSMTSGSGQLILLSDLTETRLLQSKVSRDERLSSLGKMVASLAHQIRTPLSTAMLYAGHLCQPSIDNGIRQDCAEKLLSRLTHLEHQIRDMLIFAKGETRLAEQLTVSDLFQSLFDAADPVLKKAEVECIWPKELPDKQITCNNETLVGACLNLINNSIEAMDQDKTKRKSKRKHRIEIEAIEEKCGVLSLSFKDNGPGIPTLQKDKVYEPFFTTKSQGTGLGLAVVQAVVAAHHGEFKLHSSNAGVTAQINLPVHKIQKRRQKKAAG